MSAILGNLDTDQQPPMTVPLRHFAIGLCVLLVGVGFGIGLVVDSVPGWGTLAHVHLLLAGWVCLTIMGAMTQFVPVWSGVDLHSRRLANVQLLLVTLGLLGFATAFVRETVAWLAPFGAVMLVGFWVFVYNISRTLVGVDEYDVTERHFGYAIVFFLALTALGLVLAVNLSHGILPSASVSHLELRSAHATLAVFGAVLTTIYGALYQLGTMFTQTELHGIDHYLQSVEEGGHLAGAVLLAGGRLFESPALARVGGLLVLAGAIAIAVVLGRKLVEMRVEWTPMHSRYAVLAPALVLWALFSVSAWVRQPTAPQHLFGASGSVHLLLLGVIGFVILGTLYHIVPFIIWVHQYSDRLGFEAVPMIDDLYDDRLATVDFALVLGGTVLLVLSEMALHADTVTGAGGALVTLGLCVFIANMLLVVHRHSPQPLDRIVLGRFSPRRIDSQQGHTASD
ncbi:hypothetical protein [Halovenus marina]|uniref:hypothetical protein n=1 Tax=Halovenus marina TaxID=3396621 RepID=UPI003F579117